MELFPTAKEAKTDETVRISDCQHPSARRPLRLLSSLLCLNPTHQSHITLSFVEMVVSALNGENVDWPQEFYHELTEELTALHDKHSAAKVKVEKTSVGPHITLILRAKGILNTREELEAGYRSEKALTLEEQLPNPKKTKTKEAKGVSEVQTTIQLIPSQEEKMATGLQPQMATPVYSVTPQPAETTSGWPRRVVLETTEKRQPPNALPAMVEQICQAHRRLENLLISFTVKAPPNLVNQVNTEFFKIQRETTFREGREEPPDNCSEVLLKFQGIQLKHLTKQLENSDSLNEVNIEAIFHLEEELATVQHRLEQSQEEILSLKGQKGETLGKMTTLQQVIDEQAQQLKNKDAEITKLKDRITEMNSMMERQDRLDVHRKSETTQLESQIADYQKEIAHLNTENHRLSAKITAGEERKHLPRSRPTSEHAMDPARPITGREDHTLTAGVASKLLNELRRDLVKNQQEKADLARELLNQQEKCGQHTLPQTVIHHST